MYLISGCWIWQMIFYYVVDEKLERATVVIRNSDLVHWNITPAWLWKIAGYPTRRIMSRLLFAACRTFFRECGMDEEEDDTDERPENERNVNDGTFSGADEEEPEDEKS